MARGQNQSRHRHIACGSGLPWPAGSLRLAEVKASLENDLKRKESALAEYLVALYHKKEQLLRINYKKVVAFANRLSQQKQKVHKAQQKVAARMRAADKLCRDVTQMRVLLEEDIADLPEDQGKRTKPSP
jgi:hypothetical protein